MAKQSKVTMTVKNFMDIFPNSSIEKYYELSSLVTTYNYRFSYKNLEYDLTFFEYFYEAKKTYHTYLSFSCGKKVLSFAKYSTLNLRYTLINILNEVYNLDL